MSEFCAAALARALSYCCSIESGTLEGFLDRLAWELQHESGRVFSSLAIIVRRDDGSSFVAAPRELSSLPVEVLLGLLIEENGAHIGCRVRDHALDTLRFIDPIFRSSVTTRIVFPKDLLPNGEAALWFGSRGIATSEHVKLAQSFATTCTQWLELYAPVLLSIGVYSKRVDTLKSRNSEMQAIAHDVKAPIAALKYLISESRVSDSQVSEELSRLRSELIYVERLLGKFAPEPRVELDDSANWRSQRIRLNLAA